MQPGTAARRRPAAIGSGRHGIQPARLVITSGKKKGRPPSAATVLRMLRDHDQRTTN
ncbi:hypothetical protein ACWDA3_59430 [Nonomuraea rubra]